MRHHVGNISIFKPENSPFWTAYYRDDAGSQKKKSLKTRNLKVAKERARQIDRMLQDGTVGRLDTLRRNRAVTVGEVIQRFMGELPDGPKGEGAAWSPTTIRSTASLIKRLREAWGDRPVAQVRHADLLEFLGTHTHTEAKSSYNRYRAVLRGLFRFAVEAEYIAKNPADELVFRKQPQKSPKALTDQEYTAIFQHLPEYAQIIVQILVDTGIRRSQLFRLEWGDVDTINRTLKIRNPKDGEMSLPILKKTADLLDSLRPGRTFKRAIGKNFTLIEWPDDRDSSACVVPEIDIKKSLYKASAMARLGKDRRVTIHMMRHTWATRLRRAGVALDRIQELGGWDSYEMVLRYADVPDDLRNAMDRLDQFSSGNNTDPKLTVVSQG